MCYKLGEGIEKDMDKAVYWLKKAANKGVPKAQMQLGCMELDMLKLDNGKWRTKDAALMWFTRAKEGFLKARDAGDADAEQGLKIVDSALKLLR